MAWQAALVRHVLPWLLNIATLFIKPMVEAVINKRRRKREAEDAIADGDDSSDWMRKHTDDPNDK